MFLSVKKGTTGLIVPVYLQKESDGTAYTGLAHNTSNLAIEYRRPDGGDNDAVPITLAAGTRGTYVNSGAAGSGGGFIQVDATGFPGMYELSVPAAVLATGAAWAALIVRGASDLLPCPVLIQLTDNTTKDAVDAAGDVSSFSGDAATQIDAIEADTNELQTNQGNWLTATGFAEPGDEMDLVDAPNSTAVSAIQNGLATSANVTAALSAIITQGNTAWATADLSGLPTTDDVILKGVSYRYTNDNSGDGFDDVTVADIA